MKRLVAAAVGWLLGAAAPPGQAADVVPPAQAVQAVQAHRYVTAEGVEVLTNRAAASAAAATAAAANTTRGPRAAAAEGGATLPATTAAKTAGTAAAATVAAPAAGPTAGPVVPVSHRVSASAQAQRDNDRVAILMAELLDESRALDRKRQALKALSGKRASDDEERLALQEDVMRREENVRALDRELRRATATGTGTGRER